MENSVNTLHIHRYTGTLILFLYTDFNKLAVLGNLLALIMLLVGMNYVKNAFVKICLVSPAWWTKFMMHENNTECVCMYV